MPPDTDDEGWAHPSVVRLTGQTFFHYFRNGRTLCTRWNQRRTMYATVDLTATAKNFTYPRHDHCSDCWRRRMRERGLVPAA